MSSQVLNFVLCNYIYFVKIILSIFTIFTKYTFVIIILFWILNRIQSQDNSSDLNKTYALNVRVLQHIACMLQYNKTL